MPTQTARGAPGATNCSLRQASGAQHRAAGVEGVAAELARRWRSGGRTRSPPWRRAPRRGPASSSSSGRAAHSRRRWPAADEVDAVGRVRIVLVAAHGLAGVGARAARRRSRPARPRQSTLSFELCAGRPGRRLPARTSISLAGAGGAGLGAAVRLGHQAGRRFVASRAGSCTTGDQSSAASCCDTPSSTPWRSVRPKLLK